MVVKIVACDKEDLTFGCMKVINIKIQKGNLVLVVFHIPGNCYLFTDLKKLFCFVLFFIFIPILLLKINMMTYGHLNCGAKKDLNRLERQKYRVTRNLSCLEIVVVIRDFKCIIKFVLILTTSIFSYLDCCCCNHVYIVL